jgi:cytochrome c
VRRLLQPKQTLPANPPPAHGAGSDISRAAGATCSREPRARRYIAAARMIRVITQNRCVSVETRATYKKYILDKRRTQMHRAVPSTDRAVPRPKAPHANRVLALATVALAAALGSPGVHAQLPEPTELVNAQHCMFCHTTDKRFLAPSFHEIAGRYRDTPHADAILERKLRLGGPAHWGDTPMPPPQDRGGPLSREDAHVLVQWVLSQ